MATRNFKKSPSGSHEPKAVGAILDEMLRSDSRFAVAYRDHLFPDTHLCVDLKILSRKPGRMRVGEYINCLLTRDGEDHFEAVEDALKKQVAERRNPIIFKGIRINVHRRADGTLYPTFNRPRYAKGFTFADFCREAAEELVAVAGLVERKWK